jgi:hypothetical protein
MLLHIFADTGQVDVGSNADLGEYFRVTDARELENL